MDDSPRLPLGKARSLSLPADHEANFLATFPSSTSSYGSTTNIKRYGSVRGGNMVPYSLVIVGAPDTGKTSLTVRFISAKFLSDYEPTLEDHYERVFSINGEDCFIELYDIGGSMDEDDYQLEQRDGVLLAYAINNRESFTEALGKYASITKRMGNSLAVVLIGNKCDLEKQRQVTMEEGMQASKQFNIKFRETSSVIGLNVDRVFVDIIQEIKHMRLRGEGKEKREKNKQQQQQQLHTKQDKAHIKSQKSCALM